MMRWCVISCLRKEKASTLATSMVKEGKTLDHVTSSWGEECWVITSKIVILWYYASIACLIYIIIVKIFRILKIVVIVVEPLCPLVGEECGVTHQPQMLEPPLTRCHHCTQYGGSCPRGQSLLRYQPVCLWYHCKQIKRGKWCDFRSGCRNKQQELSTEAATFCRACTSSVALVEEGCRYAPLQRKWSPSSQGHSTKGSFTMEGGGAARSCHQLFLGRADTASGGQSHCSHDQPGHLYVSRSHRSRSTWDWRNTACLPQNEICALCEYSPLTWVPHVVLSLHGCFVSLWLLVLRYESAFLFWGPQTK